MKKIITGLCGIFLLGIVALLLVPAAWLVDEATKPYSKLDYSEVNDFWWRGRVDNVNIVVRGYRLFIGDVQWQYNWSSLFSKKLCASFQSTDETLRTEGSLCYHLLDKRVSINQFSVDWLAEELGVVSGIEIAGNFSGYFQQLLFQPPHLLRVNGDVAWEEAQWHNGEKWIDFGQLLLTATGDDSHIVVHGSDVDGPIVMDITTIFNQSGLQSIMGYVEVTGTTDPSLLNTLDFFAQQQQGSRYIFSRQF